MESVLITGATSGIGEAFAREYAARGSNILLVARSEKTLIALANELSAKHRIAVNVFRQDLSLPKSAENVASYCCNNGLFIHTLVNNAGFGLTGPFDTVPLDNLEKMVVLHNLTLMKLTGLLLPSMKQAKRGGIINVSSITGFQGVPFNAVYAATKAFTLSFSEAIREELRGSGIRVCAVCPGLTKTGLFVIAGIDPYKTMLPVGHPEPVVKAAIHALEKNRAVVIPGLINKIMIHGGRLIPRSLMVKLGVILAGDETSGNRRAQSSERPNDTL